MKQHENTGSEPYADFVTIVNHNLKVVRVRH